ncbi:MAG TPA: polysaccharide deacetylase family protein [Gemmatimonadales bacterium]|nr:polysaccharide deacetylase family protein [Gemmatimonadales bacterium]
MRIPGNRVLQNLASRLGRLSSKVMILLYHRVPPAPCFDPYLLGVTPEHFGEHLEVLRRQGRPMHLRQVIQALKDGNLPRRAVVVTFDDGYADNLNYAKPVLERFDFPATVFVTAGYVGKAHEFWWDELERVVLHPGKLPERLQLEVDGKCYQWDLEGSASYSEIAFQRHADWHYGIEADPSPRHRLFRALYHVLSPLTDRSRWRALETIRAWAEMDSDARPTHRVLTPDEVVRLARGGLVEVGAHSKTHPVLGALPVAGQREEIQESKRRLEEILGEPVGSFAYPYGSRARADYTEETVALVRAAGFTCACSNLARPVRRAADPFQLPRAGTRDWNGDELAAHLKNWFRR